MFVLVVSKKCDRKCDERGERGKVVKKKCAWCCGPCASGEGLWYKYAGRTGDQFGARGFWVCGLCAQMKWWWWSRSRRGEGEGRGRRRDRLGVEVGEEGTVVGGEGLVGVPVVSVDDG